MPAFHTLRAYKNFSGMEVNNLRADCNKVIFIFFYYGAVWFEVTKKKGVNTRGKGLMPLVKDNRVLLDHRESFNYHS